MLLIDLSITLYDKEDISLLKEILIKEDIQNPVYLIENSEGFEITFEDEHEHYSLQNKIGQHFYDYEYVDNIGKNERAIKMSIKRTQSSFSSDGWGRRWNEDNICSMVYLVKKNEGDIHNHWVNPNFLVLFGQDFREYEVKIAKGMNAETNERGYVLLKEKDNEGESGILINRLFPDEVSAFWEGYQILIPKIEKDHKEFKVLQKKQKRNRSKKLQ